METPSIILEGINEAMAGLKIATESANKVIVEYKNKLNELNEREESLARQQANFREEETLLYKSQKEVEESAKANDKRKEDLEASYKKAKAHEEELATKVTKASNFEEKLLKQEVDKRLKGMMNNE